MMASVAQQRTPYKYPGNTLQISSSFLFYQPSAFGNTDTKLILPASSVKSNSSFTIYSYLNLKLAAARINDKMIAFLILVICWSHLYDFTNSILWILAEIFLPEGKRHTTKRGMNSKMTRGKSLVSIDVLGPEPLIVNAEKLLGMQNKSSIQEAVIEKVEQRGRYVSRPRSVS